MTLRYTNCCGCFTAKTGALILAILGIFSGGTGLISDSIGYGVYMPAVEERLDQFKEEILDHYEQAGEPEEQRDMVEQYLKVIDVTKDALPYVFIGQIVSSALTLLIAAMLAYGINSGKKAFMLPWLISHFICLVLMSLAVAGLFIMFCVATPGGVMSGLFFLLICSPLMALSFYFWLVVRSVYLDLKESARDRSASYEAVCKAEKNGDYAKF